MPRLLNSREGLLRVFLTDFSNTLHIFKEEIQRFEDGRKPKELFEFYQELENVREKLDASLQNKAGQRREGTRKLNRGSPQTKNSPVEGTLVEGAGKSTRRRRVRPVRTKPPNVLSPQEEERLKALAAQYGDLFPNISGKNGKRHTSKPSTVAMNIHDTLTCS